MFCHNAKGIKMFCYYANVTAMFCHNAIGIKMFCHYANVTAMFWHMVVGPGEWGKPGAGGGADRRDPGDAAGGADTAAGGGGPQEEGLDRPRHAAHRIHRRYVLNIDDMYWTPTICTEPLHMVHMLGYL